MKRVILLMLLLLPLLTIPVRAEGIEVFDRDIGVLEDQIPRGAADGLSSMHLQTVDDVLSHGVDGEALAAYLGDLLEQSAGTPLSVLLLLIAVTLLAALGESYTYSLRYTDTKEIMSVAVSLYAATVTVQPVAQLVNEAAGVVQAVSKLMTAYLPLMAGIAAFTGRVVSSAGYYAAVVGASQAVTWLSDAVVTPLLRLFLSLSISAGICPRLKLNGIIGSVGSLMKWTLTGIMTIFTAVVGLNGILESAGDTVAGRTAKFALSSLIPLVGSSVAEAYRSVKGSVNLLRSGVGVFVIVAVLVAFAPVLIKTLLWSAAISLAKITQDAFSVDSTVSILNALSSFMAVLRAVLVAVMTVFVVSTAVMFCVGGAA